MSLSNTNQNKQDEYLKSNIKNMVNSVSFKQKALFTSFLDERQQAIALAQLNKLRHDGYLFYGGTLNCDRVMLGIFPFDIKPTENVFPIQAIEVSYHSKAVVTHRDCLGSLMGLQLNRSCIGDIIVEDEKATIFIEYNVVEFVLSNLNKIGKVSVSPVIREINTIIKEQNYQEISGSVSSLRLDCIVKLLLCKSRTVATKTILSQLVKVNYLDIQNNSHIVKPNDIISIRGVGKFIMTNDIKPTKKDRFHIKINKLI